MTLRFISSMATKPLLAELAALSPVAVTVESVGGVDAAKRVRAGERFDGVVLASNAIDSLTADGHLLAEGRVKLADSGVAVAVRQGAPTPDIASEDALRRAVLSAERIGYSTGPSGTQLLQLFERWGITAQLQGRLVQAPPGVPVGSMAADGRVSLAFQQWSELMSLPGITVLGPLPASVQIVTTFAAAACSRSERVDEVRHVLALWAAPQTAETKRRHGMEPAA